MALVLAALRALAAAGAAWDVISRIWTYWQQTGDTQGALDQAHAAAQQAQAQQTVPPQAPTVGAMRDPFMDEWGDDPLIEECRLDRLLRGC